ncbi:hypothetical protein KCU79_g17654, partial [Aureobasidium melanogenum]
MKAVHKDLRSNMVTGKRDDIVQRENFIPIVRDYYGAIELLDPCWWTHYASCVLQANSQKRKEMGHDEVPSLEHDQPYKKKSKT